MLHAQRIGVGKAARLGDLIGGQGARRGRYLDRLADLGRRIGREADLDLGIARHRARDARQRGLQIVEGRGVAHGASVSLFRWQIMSSLSLGAAGLGSKRKTWSSGATGTRSGRTKIGRAHV